MWRRGVNSKEILGWLSASPAYYKSFFKHACATIKCECVCGGGGGGG